MGGLHFTVAENIGPALTLEPSLIENRTQTSPQNWLGMRKFLVINQSQRQIELGRDKLWFRPTG